MTGLDPVVPQLHLHAIESPRGVKVSDRWTVMGQVISGTVGLSGQTPDGATRRVSLHDRDARPIAKGRLGKPVEFGHKVQLVEGDDGVIVDHTIEQGNPADAPHLAPAVDRIKRRAGRPPRTVTADRGYGEESVEDALTDLGVQTS